LNLLARLKEEFRIAMLLITHDLGVVAEVADSVAVMYAGQVVEDAPVQEIFDRPRHPYTEGLLQSIPRLSDDEGRKRLLSIDGACRGLIDIPPGCRFAVRCHYMKQQCTAGDIPVLQTGTNHHSRCIIAKEAVCRPNP